jgi:asparagine synthase (glutamine-hydrolysing)
MCGIYGVICPKDYQEKAKKSLDLARVRQAHKLLRHRGPDWEGELARKDYYMAHHRLSIVDPAGGSQPITYDLKGYTASTDCKYALCVNGEIYNHQELKEQVKKPLRATELAKENNQLERTFRIVGIDENGESEPENLDKPGVSMFYPHETYQYKTGSDCEVLLALYDRAMNYYLHNGFLLGSLKVHEITIARIAESLREINGIFAFILADEAREYYLIARDQIGVIPLYYGYDSAGFIHFASEMKAFPADVIPHHFPPGHFMLVHNLDIGQRRPELHKYYTNLDMDPTSVGELSINTQEDINTHFDEIQKYATRVRETLTKAVERQLMTDVPFGALLSGGLDSSLVCSIACKALAATRPGTSAAAGWGNKLQTFSIGLEGGSATDLEAAARAAQWLGTRHHNFTFTIDEGLAAIRDVIWHLETYDVTTIRASTPMYLLARKIKAMGIKMVLSGEGSDEIFGGYLYFLQAPDDLEHTKECIRRVSQLSLFDCLRANKSTMAWGLEARPPFLDTELVKLGLEMPSALKKLKRDGRPVEKWILRAAFDVRDPATNEPVYLPDDLLWRQKEQFSDGVGYGWIDRLKAEADQQVSDYILSLAPERFPVNTPKTKEEYRYRVIFEELFPNRGAEYTVQKWVPKTEWSGVGYDPSGRAQAAHLAAL